MARYSDADRQAMNEATTAEDQRCLAAVLLAAARSRGGMMMGNAAEFLALSSPQPGWPASAIEMRQRGLPELAKKPGFGGITCAMVGRDLWEVRALAPTPAPGIALVSPVAPIPVAAAPTALPRPQSPSSAVTPQVPRPTQVPAPPALRQAPPPKALGTAAQKEELLKAVPSPARREAANAAAWAALDQAASEIFDGGRPSVPMQRRVEAVQTVFVRWLNADPSKADEEALTAARQALGAQIPPPRAA